MPSRFLHSVAVQEQNIAADTIRTDVLAVNPLSVVLIALRPLNDTGTLANFTSYRNVCAALNRVSILYQGETIVGMRGEDAAAMAYFRHGIVPFQGQHDDTNDERRCVVLPILLGREAYHPKSCFPAVRRGELTLELDIDIADTGYNGMNISVETIELLDAKPSEYERKVQIGQTWVATGDQDFDLPPGNMNRGLLLFGTTPFAGATPAPSWGRVKVLMDNQETHYTASDFEVAQMLHCLYGRQPPMMDAHTHRVTTDGNAQAELTTIGGAINVGAGFHQYAFLDFDPTRDDYYTLDTAKHTRFHLRSTVETADAVRVIPIEVIKL